MADSPGWTQFLGMGAVVAAQLAVGVVIGLLLDAQLSTTPIFVLVGVALGIVGAVAFTVSQFRKYLRTTPSAPPTSPDSTDHNPQRSE